jgi:hypothetical protein
MKSFILTIICAALSTAAMAQDATKITPYNKTTAFSDPEVDTHTPVQLSKDEAEREAYDNLGFCGFSGAYFKKEDLEKLLSLEGCTGLRFYNGKENTKNFYASVIAVAIDAKGKELGVEPNYALSVALDQKGSVGSKMVAKTYAKQCVSNLDASKSFIRYTSFVSKSVLVELLTTKGSTGLRVRPAQRFFEMANGSKEMLRTVTVSAATVEGDKVIDVTDHVVKSLLPCPTCCGDSDGGYLLPLR